MFVIRERLYAHPVYVCIPRSFLVINVCKMGKILCSPCISLSVGVWWRVGNTKLLKHKKTCIHRRQRGRITYRLYNGRYRPSKHVSELNKIQYTKIYIVVLFGN